MQRRLLSASRGQALLETALALPVFLIVTFGIMWALQSGALGERVQLAARYGGMVSTQGNPYDQFSFYALYRAAGGAPIVPACAAAPTAMLVNGGPVQTPAVATPAFWQPVANSPAATATCGRTLVTAGGLSAPKVLGHAQFAVSAQTGVPEILQAAMGALTTSTASLNELESPDVGTLVVCYPELAAAIANTFTPAAPSGAAPAPQPIGALQTAPLALSASCGG